MPKVYPLTEQQKGLWFEYELDPENFRYNSYVHYEILGSLNEEKFFQTLHSLTEHFELFKIRFIKNGDQIYQTISESRLPQVIEYVDLSHLNITKEKAKQLLIERSLSPYDLKKCIPTRIHLIKISSERYYFSVEFHHIVADAFSASLYCQFISEHYNATEAYSDNKIRKGIDDYLNFLSTSDEYSEINKEKSLSYWQDKISGKNSQFDFKVYSPKLATLQRGEEAFELGEEIFSKIKNFCKQHTTTPFLFLTGVFSALLYRYWNQKQIIIGYPTNIRPNGYQNSLGFYITTFPFCIEICEQKNFIEHIQKLTDQRREDKKHENITFPEMSKFIFRTDTTTEAYFNILHVSTPFNIDIHLNNMKVNNIAVYGGTPRNDLMLLSDFSASSLPCRLRYNATIFEKSLIRQFINHIKILASESLNSPFQSLSELNFIATEEKQQLLLTWNDTTKDYPREKTIHQLFEEQVQKTPHNIAVVYEDESLTYKALNEKANQLAHLLRAQGAGPDTLVAIAMDRSLEMIIGLLGILKAGGAYVPLDPDYPTDRLQFMLEDTNAPLFVTQSFLKDKLDPLLNSYQGSTLFLDQALNDDLNFFYENEADKTLVKDSTDLGCTQPLSSYPKQNPIPLSTPLNLAYIIYTSGSTGKPKGVGVSHRSLHNVIAYFKKQHKIKTVLALTSFTFDISGIEIYLPLLQGAKIFLASLEMTKDRNLLIKFINKVGPNLIQATPSGWSMIENSQLCSLSSLDVLCGGENLPQALAQHLLAISPCVWNVYGPTETTIWSTQSSLSSSSSTISIGHPISNTQVYILDAYMNPLPIGITGEIYIGGEGLARGYLNRPELTAERFVPNPFAGKYIDLENALPSDTEPSLSSLRLYKTGDIARYLPDGNIEFLGRSDDQVKIRGFRIECGEIQTALSAHGEVASSLIIPREDEQGHKRLIAYVIPKNMDSFKEESVLTSSTGESFKRLIDTREGNSFTEELRTHLTTSLPDYMIPAFFVLVDRFPLTPNGKIDKASLPDPDLSLREETFVAPRTKIEEDLSHIWSEVLGISPISIHDNFFRIGGHSLLATQVISRIRQVFSRDIPIRAIFDAPTIKDLALHISQTQTSELPPILPVERPEHIPLSFAQERLWFLDQFLPNSPLYNIPVALKLKGDLNRDALEKSFNILIDRHESLRTIFKEENGIPAQVILSPFSISLSPVDYSTSENPQTEVMAVAQEEASTPFVLSQGPLLRVRLLRLGEKDHILLLTCHHIIFDGWSFEIFFKELSTLYCLFIEKQDLILPPLPLQYADFTLWQRQWFRGEDLNTQLTYWQNTLQGAPDLLPLPTDKPRPKELSYTGGLYITTLSKELQEQLHALAQANQTSLFMTLLAIFQVLLTRYTGEKDIVVGSPIAGRQYKEIEGLLGFFVNTLAIRTIFKDQDTFHDALKQVRSSTLEAYAHQDLPFEQLVDHLKIERVTNRNPLFQVELSVESTTKIPPSFLNGIEVKQIQSNTCWSRFDLRALILDSQDGLTVYLEYARDLFYEETIKKIATHFELLIKDILKNPNKKISDYSFLTPQEEEQLLLTWNDTTKDYPREKTIHQLFEEQVQKTPHNIAVVYEDESLTYKALNEKANQLAHLLQAQGIGSDTLVAIAMDRSLEMIIGLLGILKAGGAYVPLDPEYPSDRLQFMLEDTNAPFIITDLKNIDKLPSTWAQIICLDDPNTQINQYPFTNPTPLATPLNLAYVIYTSGSTGKPKGVEIEHKEVVNYIYYNLNQYDSPSFGTTLLHSSIVFDMSITSLFFPLSRGDTLSLLQREHKTENILLSLKKNQDITYIKLTPAHLQILKEDLPNLLSQQRRFIIGGESLLQEDIMPYLKEDFSSNNLIINEYGPTEATVGCSVFAITSSTSLPSFSSTIPIGKPIANAEIYILDGEMQPVPIGVRGEIYIGGEGLARGYLNRPELTAERFVPNPFAGKYIDLENALPSDTEPSLSSLRLYKTGDIARYLPDGNIEFLGRSDDQVKIRGFRIECGEIQTALSAHGEVASSLIIPREDEQGHKRLIAYVIPKNMDSFKEESVLTSSTGESFKRLIDTREGNSFTEELRTHLTTSLPDYMIPAFFVLVDRFPLTPNGKIDKASLPDPDLSLREETFVAPRTKIEEDLSHIWSEVLGISPISIHDNFFRIGGHSLLATQVISRIRQVFSRDIPIRAIFDAPTIKDLALHISQTQTSELPPILPVERPEHIPLSFAQERLWFLDQFLPNSPLYNIPVALKLKGDLNRDALEKSFNILIDRHESLRTIFKEENGIPAQVILSPFSISLSPVDYSTSENPQTEVMAVAQEEASTPFVLSQGPLLRVRLLRLGEKDHILLLTCHHIIFDGWSSEIFFKELSASYNAYAEGKEPLSPSLPIQYADFALWQRNWLQGDILEQQLSYWKQQLAGTPDLLELPTDKPRPKELTYRGASYHTTLSKELQEQLHALAQANQTSLFMTLLAIFQVLLTRYTGEKDIVVGSPIAGRQYKEIEGLLGFFVNTLAIRTIFKDQDTFHDALKQVRSSTLEAYAHQDLPFEQLVDHLKIERVTNRNPLFQVMFALQSVTTDETLSDLQISQLPLEHTISKFDLTLNALEQPEGISLAFEYATDLFEENTIKRMASHLEELIKGCVKDPSQSIQEVSLLKKEEKQQLLLTWNDTTKDYPREKTIHQLFEEQVQKTPHNIAVVYEDESLTYKALNEKANQLAHLLRAQGVGPDTLVAIAMDRSLEMIIGLLGILKAGGAYVPLDPDYPTDRLQFMLEDTNAPLFVTQSFLKDKLDPLLNSYQGSTLFLDQALNDDLNFFYENEADKTLVKDSTDLGCTQPLSSYPKQNPIPLSTPLNLAYIIYTSGSTGKPKGVGAENSGVVNCIYAIRHATQVASNITSLALTSLSFDVAALDYYLPLSVGAKVILTNPIIQKDGLKLISLANQHGISTIQATPSLFKMIIATGQHLNHPVKIMLAGEILTQEICQSLTPVNQLFNIYGPTEATIYSTLSNINQNTPISIGHPISNTQVYILDAYMNPLPIGITGEIYIGGVGLARGYLNRPELTAERFVPNPFAGKYIDLENALPSDTEPSLSSLRLYKTGDIARYLPDGNIEFLGRSDDQVKIRGFRIECGEIQTALSAHGEVASSLIIPREDEQGHKRLIAYVIPKNMDSFKEESVLTSSTGESFKRLIDTREGNSFTEELRTHLTTSLPDYMIPAFFVLVDRFPLTPNGKIDKASLPDPDLSLREETFVAPRTKIEEDLSHIWSEVLGISPISIHDNFFRIGGHSLLATQVISRIRQVFSRDIPIRAIFDAPTIKDLALHISQTQTSELPPILPVERPEHIPLSFAQERLWFLDQFLPNSPLYNIPVALKLKGDLNRDALEKSFNILIDRHESLRTIFKEENGIPAQVILSPFSISLSPVDYSTSENPQTEVMAVAQEEASTPFVLSQGPLLRVRLLRLGEKDHILLLTCHHIIFDGWSFEIFFKELSTLYCLFIEKQDLILPPLPLQYADFTLWQRQWFRGEDLNTQLTYWQNTLQGAPDLLPLPTDKPRPKELSYTGGLYITTLSKELQEQLHALAQANQTSLFMTLLAIFQVLLTRYTGEKDIVVGSPIAGRQYKEIEGLLGFFVNTLAIRTIFKDQDTFHDALKQVRSSTLEAYAHQDLPFEQLVDHLKIERVTNRNPLFQVELSVESTTKIPPSFLNGIEVKQIQSNTCWSRFDLRALILDSQDGLTVYLEYARDLFYEETIKKIATHFELLIKDILKNPNKKISDYSFLTPQEEEQLLLTWNDTTKDYPREKTIHQLFEEQVQKTPHNIAVVYEDESLTYKALNEKANQLAHLLQAQGIGSDTLVAIAMDRSLEMIIGLLGILKAGGAYVPLDPEYPSDRLQFMLEDTNAPFIITDLKNIDKLPSTWAQIICLDDPNTQINQYPFTNPTPLATPLNLAYVIYTSGSTGKPKGVEIEHKEVVNYIYYNLNQYDSPSFGTTLLHSSIVFDMSITSLFFPLSRGDTLSLLQREHKTENILLSLKKNQDITYIKLTPAHLQILKEDLPNLLSQQRRFIIGGESLLQEDIMPYLKEDFSSNNLIINEYGPTEATVGCSVFAITSSTSLPSFSSTIPIGKPIANAEIYILDGEMQPVPIGVRGEIYIGGEGLARGYLNRPELTAERFVPNPFAGKYIDLENALPSDTEPSLSSLRLYKTGDIARYLPDGNIEFLGRSDDQVKIRGFRIECGEIQTALSAHGEVASSLIIPREDEQGHKRLIAYVIPKNMDSFKEESVLTSSTGESFKRLIDTREGNSFTEELRTHLTTSLPDYMIPAFFVLVDRFPLTPNGKIDKASLPDPDLSLREETFVAPRTKIEEDLSHIWSEVLGISPISIHDNFFRIGGDSIISIQIVSKARQRGIPLTVKDIFAAPTISGLAAQALVAKDTFLAPTQGELQGPLPLTPIQSWFFERDLKEENHYNQATLLKLNHKLSPQQLKDALSLLLQHHDILRASYHYDSNTWIQSYLPVSAHDALHFFLEKDLSLFTGEDFDLKIHEEATKAQESLHIDQGILLKAVLFHGDEKRGDRLLLVIHHLAVDGVSWRILLDDLQMLLEGTPLPPKTHAYRDWGETLKIYVQSEEALKELPYWAKVEESLSPLSTDFPQSKTPLYAAQNVSLTKNETTLLLREVPKAYRTEINDVLLTALTLAIGDWSKDYTLSLLLEGHGREDLSQALDISRTIGWFTSIFPVSLHLSDPSQIGECLKSVKEQLRSIPKKGIGYGILRYLHKESPLRAPLPRLSFNYLGQWDTTLQEEGIFSFAKESSGNASSPLNTEESFLNLNGSVQDGIFFLSFGYDQSLYKEETIRAITTAFLKRLREIIEHTTSKNVFGYTPSDFDLVKDLSQIDLVYKIIGQ